jgi:fumarate reductase flavoprotein subunit
MKKDHGQIDRRQFLGALSLGTAVVTGGALVGSLSGCSSPTNDTTDNPSGAETAAPPNPTKTIETDVAVVGVGMAGLLACILAADNGAQVIGIDRLQSFSGCNGVYTSGMWVTGSAIQAQYPNTLTEEEAFKHIYTGTIYQSNAKLLRHMVHTGGLGADILFDYGLLAHAYEDLPPDAPITLRASFFFTKYYDERGAVYAQILEEKKVEMMWETQATQLIWENGEVCGVYCTDATNTVIAVRAKAVVISTGGFIQSQEMIEQYLGGSRLVAPGNLYCDGTGIKMCQAVGAQMGKNFSAGLNESGGANEKASPAFPLASPGFTYTNLFSFPLLGGLCVDKYGTRFVDESLLAEHMMFSGEPVIREKSYYYICDDALMQRLTKEPISTILDPVMYAELVDVVKATFEGKTWTDIYKEFDQAIGEGWAWKADNLAMLAEQLGMTELEATIQGYNGFCSNGQDTEMYKDPRFLQPVSTGPFYAINMQTSAFMTIGGIKCDQNCQALDANCVRIPGLFVAGGDADLWAVPYYQGGTCCGFGVASGYIAGEAAAKFI